VVVVDDTRVLTEVAVKTLVDEKMSVSMVTLVASTVVVGAVAVGIVIVDVVGVTLRQLQARERREAGWRCSSCLLTMEGQVALALRFFFFLFCCCVSGGFTNVLVLVTKVEVSVVRVVVSSVVVVSIVVVVDVVDVLMTVDESTGVTVASVTVTVTGLMARKSRQNSTACSANSTAQTGDTFREQVKYLSTLSTEHTLGKFKLGLRAVANGTCSRPTATTPKIRADRILSFSRHRKKKNQKKTNDWPSKRLLKGTTDEESLRSAISGRMHFLLVAKISIGILLHLVASGLAEIGLVVLSF